MNFKSLFFTVVAITFSFCSHAQERFLNQNNDECQTFVLEKDRKGRPTQVQTNLAKLTAYTPKKLTNYYKEKDYLTVSTAVGTADGDPYLDFEFRFYSKDVSKSYGVIRPGDISFFKTLKGDKIYIRPLTTTTSSIEQYTGNTIYRGQFVFVNKSDYGLLKKGMLDELNILWSSGFETYPIYNLDFYKAQISCLNDKN